MGYTGVVSVGVWSAGHRLLVPASETGPRYSVQNNATVMNNEALTAGARPFRPVYNLWRGDISWAPEAR